MLSSPVLQKSVVSDQLRHIQLSKHLLDAHRSYSPFAARKSRLSLGA